MQFAHTVNGPSEGESIRNLWVFCFPQPGAKDEDKDVQLEVDKYLKSQNIPDEPYFLFIEEAEWIFPQNPG